jgi:hypothetical protein
MCRFSVKRPGGGVYVQASRPKSAAPFSIDCGSQLPATSQQTVPVWSAICRNGGRLRTVTIATASAMLMGSCFASTATFAANENANDSCADDTRKAVALARQALEATDRDHERTALACLVEAVVALDDRIQGLASGSVPFEGQIYAPKRVVMVKPSDQEGR